MDSRSAGVGKGLARGHRFSLLFVVARDPPVELASGCSGRALCRLLLWEVEPQRGVGMWVGTQSLLGSLRVQAPPCMQVIGARCYLVLQDIL